MLTPGLRGTEPARIVDASRGGDKGGSAAAAQYPRNSFALSYADQMQSAWTRKPGTKMAQ